MIKLFENKKLPNSDWAENVKNIYKLSVVNKNRRAGETLINLNAPLDFRAFQLYESAAPKGKPNFKTPRQW